MGGGWGGCGSNTRTVTPDSLDLIYGIGTDEN